VQKVAEKAKLFALTSPSVPTGDLLGWNVGISFGAIVSVFCTVFRI